MTAIRPQNFADFSGQASSIAQLKVAVRSAVARGKALGHVLITGPRGLGKTTLATGVIPNEMGAKVRSLVCASIEKPTELTSVLSTMQAGEILFLDEIHSLPRQLHEMLYGVMEDSQLVVTIGEGPNAKVLTVELPEFTLVAATTREAMLPAPMLDRFKHQLRLELYSSPEMGQVLDWTARANGVALLNVAELIPACHGTARHAGRLIEACIDTLYAEDGYAAPATGPSISNEIVRQTLQRLGYSANGLTKPEVALLQRLEDSDGPVGLNTLAAILDEESSTVETVFEPWLLQKNLLAKTPSGRTITAAGKTALRNIKWKDPQKKSG